MGLVNAPGIATNGLAFVYDLNNYKSYQGPAISNNASFLNINTGSSNGYSSTSTLTVENIPTLGPTTFRYNTIQNNYPAVSTNCCPSPFGFNNGRAALPSTLYTYAIVYKCDSGYTNNNYMYRYEYTANGGTLTIEQGIHTTTNRVHLGNDWYWAWNTFTTQATTNWFGYLGAFYYRYSTEQDRLAVAKVLVTPGNYTGLHPRYWTDANTSLANTANLRSLVSPTAVTTSNVTYTSSGTFTFNGIDDYIEIAQPNITLSPNRWTICGWIKPGNQFSRFLTPQSNGVDQWLEYDNTNQRINVQVTESADVNNRLRNGTINTVPIDQWSYFSISINELSIKIYINGVLTNDYTETISIGNWEGTWVVGQRGNSTSWFSGELSVLQVYNRALSATEISQNFSALRGRFGV